MRLANTPANTVAHDLFARAQDAFHEGRVNAQQSVDYPTSPQLQFNAKSNWSQTASLIQAGLRESRGALPGSLVSDLTQDASSIQRLFSTGVLTPADAAVAGDVVADINTAVDLLAGHVHGASTLERVIRRTTDAQEALSAIVAGPHPLSREVSATISLSAAASFIDNAAAMMWGNQPRPVVNRLLRDSQALRAQSQTLNRITPNEANQLGRTMADATAAIAEIKD